MRVKERARRIIRRVIFMFNFFLVLGLVPGTNFQITFNELVFGMFVLTVAYYVYHHQQQSKEKAVKVIQYSRLHSFSYPVSAQLAPELQIARKVAALLANTFSLRLNQVVRLVRRAA